MPQTIHCRPNSMCIKDIVSHFSSIALLFSKFSREALPCCRYHKKPTRDMFCRRNKKNVMYHWHILHEKYSKYLMKPNIFVTTGNTQQALKYYSVFPIRGIRNCASFTILGWLKNMKMYIFCRI